MNNIYQNLFKILLIVPVLGVFSSMFLNKYFKAQKIINNITYTAATLLCSYLIILFTAHGQIEITLLNISKNIPMVFALTPINLFFCLFISIGVLFFNLVFQNFFNNLELDDKYPIYNKQIATLYLLCTLISFSHSLILTIFLYILMIVFCYLLITNPDLKDIRKAYSTIFSITLVSSSILLIMAGFYFLQENNSLFLLQNMNKLKNIPIYWLISSLFLLILINLSGPICLLFMKRVYYEDLLPIFIILFLPLTIVNTFLFTKILYYIFSNSFNNIGLYFYYTGFFIILLFISFCTFAIKYAKNGIKFSLLFCFISFTIFLSQLLFINTEYELVRMFIDFLLLILAITLPVLVYSGILFILLKSNVSDTNVLYKYSKIELNFYIGCLFAPILVNLISFFDLNFHNFNILYLINLAEIVIFIGIYLYQVYILIGRKIKPNANKPEELSQNEKIKFFAPQLGLVCFFLFLILLKGQIVKFIIFYK